MSSSQTPSSSNSGHDVSQSSAVDKNDNKNKDVLKRHANKHPSSCATPSSASASPPSPSIPLSPILPPSPRSSSPRLSRRSTLHKPLPSIHFEKAPVPTWTSESQRPVGLPPCVIHSPDGGRYVWFAAVDTDGIFSFAIIFFFMSCVFFYNPHICCYMLQYCRCYCHHSYDFRANLACF